MSNKVVNVLISGASGQLGSALLSKLDKAAEFKVVGLIKSQLDICNKQQVLSSMERLQPDVVVNCAAYTWVDGAETELELCTQINEIGAKYLAQACEKHNAVLLHLSTDYVFDGEQNHPYIETDVTKPLNQYGQSKLASEKWVSECCPKHIIVRTSSLFALKGKNFCTTILNAAGQGKELNVVADQISSPTYVLDLVNTIATILTRLFRQKEPFEQWGIYHYCGQSAISWYDFAIEVLNSQGFTSDDYICHPITLSELNAKAKRPRYSVLNCTKIESVFGVKPSDWRSAIYNQNSKFSI